MYLLTHTHVGSKFKAAVWFGKKRKKKKLEIERLSKQLIQIFKMEYSLINLKNKKQTLKIQVNNPDKARQRVKPFFSSSALRIFLKRPIINGPLSYGPKFLDSATKIFSRM